jgi:hypothetical protein
MLFSSTLKNLLQSFLNFKSEKKHKIDCLWDLCRLEPDFQTSDFNFNDIDYGLKLDYTLLFCCNKGSSGFCYPGECTELNGVNIEKGTIFTNLFLNNLQPKKSLHDLGILINEDIKKLKQTKQHCMQELSTVYIHSSCSKQLITDEPNDSATIDHFQRFYWKSFEQEPVNNELFCSYEFIKDDFENTIKFEVTVHIQHFVNIRVIGFQHAKPLIFSRIKTAKPRTDLYRIFNILNPIERNKFKFQFEIYDDKWQQPYMFEYETCIPKYVSKIYEHLNTEKITREINHLKFNSNSASIDRDSSS